MATATAKTVKVQDLNQGIKIECEACYEEEGSYSCIRPAHPAYKGRTKTPITEGILATAIIEISEAAQKLSKSGLNRRGVVALLNDDTKLGKGTIETVLVSLENLSRNYTK